MLIFHGSFSSFTSMTLALPSMLLLKLFVYHARAMFNFDVGKILEPNVDIDNFLTHYNVYESDKFIKLIKLLK